jgi:hypothetical protein
VNSNVKESTQQSESLEESSLTFLLNDFCAFPKSLFTAVFFVSATVSSLLPVAIVFYMEMLSEAEQNQNEKVYLAVLDPEMAWPIEELV